ncbi:hypothetical protein [Pseudomonas sp. HY7a-MNA-CIBAN-0227]|uniref:hypothetical protein n=1 Tax=Pseudomonas sp. HY7a-MNA-CIBAN-0227 TaxID=3140474 RepID=UPI00331D2784
MKLVREIYPMWNTTIIKNFIPLRPEVSLGETTNPSMVGGVPTLCWHQNSEVQRTDIHAYPIITNKDTGELWKEANLYLFDITFNVNMPELEPETILSKSKDLAEMRNILDEDETSYLSDSLHKVLRPTYVLCERLGERLGLGRSKDSCIRIIRNTISFYEWLQENKHATFKYPLWKETEITIPIDDDIGRTIYLEKKRFDLIWDFRKRSKSLLLQAENEGSSNDTTIIDGGRLTPLEPTEQIQMFESLRESNRYSIGLSFQFSISSGARIESTFTLKKKHFEKKAVDNGEYVHIAAGPGTGIDTKRDKPQILEVSGLVYNKIKTYLDSPDYKELESKAPIYKDAREQYVFLTDQGNPYYSSSDHRMLHNFNGGTIRKFIGETLKPLLNKRGFYRSFSFHDLRATCGINMINANLHLVESGEISRDRLLNMVRKKLNLNSINVALQYLGYNCNHKIESKTQDAWETFLFKEWDDFK